MQTRPALLLVLVLALLATGCAKPSQPLFGDNDRDRPLPPPDLEVPAETRPCCIPSPPARRAKAQVEALVASPGEGSRGVRHLYSWAATVTIDQDTGYWTYETGQDIFSVDPSALPPPLSDAQAQAIALDYLQTHGLWSGPMASVGVGPITSGETGGDTILGKNVYCFPAVDGAPVEGVFRIVVTRGPHGEGGYGPPPGRPARAAAGGPPEIPGPAGIGPGPGELLFQPLPNPHRPGGGDLHPPALRRRTPVEGQTYLYPVYVLTGHGTMPDGTTEWFEVIVDAQA